CRKNRACAFLAGFRVVWCLFYRFSVRNALRASQAVLITDVMVNKSDDEATIRLNLCYLIAHDYDMCINYFGKYAFACYAQH
ncbi:hypothetical protein, partial [Klebsiella pneumoniae]|uniref:hypothetical protein n=1 Tax=Klebsiella pneumoniae TaxID=573 RepID=UPI00379A6D0D